ncbi:MAG: TRAM domain-containing protein, partial [Gordonia sp. (in: high G+C Gram-positive bacteria)]
MTTLTLQVDRPANGGAAVGRDADGRVVFVHGAIPGETVTATVVGDKPGFRTAEATAILAPSPHRVTGLCAAAAAGAGCCDLAFIAPDHARTLKEMIVRDTLIRVGKFPAATVDGLGARVTALPGGATGWRIRTRLA